MNKNNIFYMNMNTVTDGIKILGFHKSIWTVPSFGRMTGQYRYLIEKKS